MLSLIPFTGTSLKHTINCPGEAPKAQHDRPGRTINSQQTADPKLFQVGLYASCIQKLHAIFSTECIANSTGCCRHPAAVSLLGPSRTLNCGQQQLMTQWGYTTVLQYQIHTPAAINLLLGRKGSAWVPKPRGSNIRCCTTSSAVAGAIVNPAPS